MPELTCIHSEYQEVLSKLVTAKYRADKSRCEEHVSEYGIIYFMIRSPVSFLPTSALFGSTDTTAGYLGRLISNKGKVFLVFLISYSSDGVQLLKFR